MSEYIILAESIVFKNDRLTCINIYDNFRTIALPAEFNFDMVIMCGPKWKKGEHKLEVKAKASNGKEIELGNAVVNIPNDDFVYNAFLNNIKVTMDYSVTDLTFYVYDNGKEAISRKYSVIPMLVPQQKKQENEKDTILENKNKDEKEEKEEKKEKKDKKKK